MASPQPEDRLPDVAAGAVGRRVRWAICAWLAGMTACNLLASVLLVTPVATAAGALLLGLASAQLSLLVFWGALGTRPFAVRWFQAVVAAELLLAAALAAPSSVAWLASALPVAGDEVLVQAATFAFSLPACLLVASGVLALLRPHGYRLVGWAPSEQPPEAAPFQFTLSDLCGLTLAVAVTLAMLRWGFQCVEHLPDPKGYFAAMVIPPFLGSILTIVIVFGSIETLLAPKGVSGRGCVSLIVLGWLLAFAPCMGALAVGPASIELFPLLLVLFFVGLLGPLVGSLLWLRRLGIMLETPQSAVAAADNPFAPPGTRPGSSESTQVPSTETETSPHGPAEH